MRRRSLFTLLMLAGLAGFTHADDATPVTPQPPAASDPASPDNSEATGGLPALQPGDEPALPLKPVRKRTDEEEQRLKALAHFMTGELFLARAKPDLIPQALNEFEKSIELNPTAIEPYRLLIPAAIRSGDDDRAQKYAILATQHTDDGVQLLRALVAVQVQQRKLDKAITALNESLKLESLSKKSFARLVLQRHLGQCYTLNKQPELASDAYEVLFADLQPEPENLSENEFKQLYGDKGELYEDMGNAFLANSKPDLAVRAFDTSASKHDRSPGLHSFNLAQVFRQTGNLERALEELNKYFAAQRVEKGRAPYQLLKELLAELNRESELFPRLQELAKTDKHNKFLHHFLANELVAQGQLDEAEAIYTAMGGQSDPEALLGLATIYRRQGKADEWIKTGSRAFSILQLSNARVRERLSPEVREMGDRFIADVKDMSGNAEQTDAILKRGRELATGDDPQLEFDAAWLLGRLSTEAKRTDDVGRFYKYAIGMQNLPSIDLYRELGGYYIDQEHFRDAEKTFEEAAGLGSLEPFRFFFLSLVSMAREMDGRIDEAVTAIQESRKLQPDEPQLALQEARIYYRARRWDEAISIFESIVRDFRDKADLVRDCQFSMSAIYVQKGDYDRGEKILLDILEKEPDHAQANNDLGYLWADRDKNIEQAYEMVQKALAAEPENAAYMDSMGWILYRKGEYERAIEYLEKAAATPRGEDSTIYDHLGDCQIKLGRQEEAVKAWKKALELEQAKSTPDPKMVESLEKKLPQESSNDSK